MITYILRRLLLMLLLLVVVSFLTFVIFFVFPSADPAVLRAGRAPSPELLATIRHNLGLDQPWYQQYFIYIKHLALHLDLGYSYQNSESVKEQVFARLPATISLTAGAAVIWLVVGLSVGTLSALRPRSKLDRIAMTGSLAGISAPAYWLGLVALYLFASDIGVIPLLPGANSYVPISENPVKWFTSLLLPWAVLAASFAAVYARLLRANLMETMQEDYIRTAYAKGLRKRQVVRHGLRAAIAPIVTLAGLDIATLLGGAVLVEAVFNVPGIGRYAFDGIQRSDLPVIQGVVVFGTLFVVLANLMVDIAYAFLDPRVRLQ